MTPKKYTVLLIEDNPGDIRLTQEAFREAGDITSIEVVTDGIEAVAYLQQKAAYRDKGRPDLILLDLNLPRWGGLEVLQKIKSEPELRRIPIVVLTTSNAKLDILNSYDLYANCFITKPVDFDSFFHIIKRIQEFWLDTVNLPGRLF
jgi:CheY-like chemotaxis protein